MADPDVRRARTRALAARMRAVLLLVSALASPAVAQDPVGAPAARRPFTIDVGGFYHALDNGYSDWRGVDARIGYTGQLASPFASLSSQYRAEGHQNSYGLGSYLTLNRWMYSIVGFSVATGGTAIFYPRLRWDVSLMSDTRVIPGLVVAAGFTRVSFGGGATGTIASLGPIYYHGPLILSGAMHLNHDDVGGASTGSGEIGGQYGGEGRYWLGANLNAGREAYQLLSATPFDVRFTNVGGAVFYQHWLTPSTAVMGRLEYQDKLTAYHRVGVSTSYRVAF